VNLAASRLIVLPHASAYRRLVGIVAGVAVATAMLLILLGTYLHLPDRADRFAWIEIPRNAEAPVVDGEPVAPSSWRSWAASGTRSRCAPAPRC